MEVSGTWGAEVYGGGRLTVDLGALVANYRVLQARAAPAEVAAVVKAEAYGLGAVPLTSALVRAGCQHVFVAQLDEALALAPVAADAAIYVLGGLWPGAEAIAVEAGAVPVLSTWDHLRRWREAAVAAGRRLPAVLQIDTGMSRLGLSCEEGAWLAARADQLDGIDLRFLMTHFACADRPADEANARQRAAFAQVAAGFPGLPRSLANSAACLADPAARGDVVRCGLALFGGQPVAGVTEPLRPVVSVCARVIQVRTVAAGEGVGYGLTYRAAEPRMVATVAAGYADGWPCALGGRGAVFFGASRLPILGRVSMDSLMVDASDLPAGRLQNGDEVELIGPHQSLEEVAAQAGTIAYEILTGLSRRFVRTYLPAEAVA